MELLVAVDDILVKKVLAAASFADIVPFVVSKGYELADLISLHPCSSSLLLKVGGGYIAQHTAILRYIGNNSLSSSLIGLSEFDSAQVPISNSIRNSQLISVSFSFYLSYYYSKIPMRLRLISGLILLG